jgi:multimeric flavodoxin WrbA
MNKQIKDVQLQSAAQQLHSLGLLRPDKTMNIGKDKPPSLLVFQGSFRRRGNTEILCLEAIGGAHESGMEARLVRLAGLEILPCRGCFKCKGGRCRGNRDDMNEILEEMIDADAFIFATPVYFWNVSGLMKMFFDRLLPLLTMRREGNRIRLLSRVEGRKAGIIVVQEEEQSPHESIPLIFFRRNLSDFGLRPAGEIFAYGALQAGDVRENRKAMQEARQLGRDLAR